MVRVLTDSTADLPAELVEQYGITVIPLSVHIDGRQYRDDGIDIGRREFYKKLRSARQLPHTSQPSVGDFQRVFRELTSNGDEVVCLTISSAMSGTYMAACNAAESLPSAKIHVVDSHHVSIALGQLVIWAAKEAIAGRPALEIVDTVRRLGERIKIVFLVDTLEYLHKGGRIGTASALVGTLLNVKPILTVRDGIIQPLQRARSKQNARGSMLMQLEQQIVPGARVWAAIAHADNASEAAWLAEEVKSRYDCQMFYVAEMGPVVGTHVGPGLVGAALIPIEEE